MTITATLNKSEIFTFAHQIVKFKDAGKLGNNIFRFTTCLKYASRLSTALKYIYRQMKKLAKNVVAAPNRGKNTSPTLNQWDFLQKNRVDLDNCNNYKEFCITHTKATASRIISQVIEAKNDGFRNF